MPHIRPVRLAYVVTHPIQYQAPLLRRIAREPGIDLTVLFTSDFSLNSYPDEGFGVSVAWDVPLVEGYRHEFLPKLWGKRINTVSRGLFSRLRGFDVVWIHGYHQPNSIQALFAAKALGIPVLLRAESWLQDRDRSALKLTLKFIALRILRELVDAVLPIGTRNATYWKHYFGQAFPQFSMPYAVDNHYFQVHSQAASFHREALCKELDLEPGRPIVLFASKLQPRKRCVDLIAAFSALGSSGLTPAPYLVIVGDGEQRASLQAQAAPFPNIRFVGFRNQSELAGFFDLAHVFVLPAQHERWGLIVNEVMNASRPIILSDAVGCQPDLVRNGMEGYVFPVGDVGALETALRQILCDPPKSQAMGARALQTVTGWSFEEDIRGLREALAYVTNRRLIPESVRRAST